MKKKQNKWLKFRHKIVRNILCFLLKPYCVWKYGIKVERFKEQEDRPYLILYNHQTAFDQFFVGMAFKGPIYYLASEDLFSKGFVSSIIRWLVNPIPIKKQANDIAAVLNCMRVAKEGGTIAIAPEGNRTYSGKTEYMNPSIAMLVKKLKLPVLLYHIEGGYGVHPRWSDVVRKGKMRSYVAKALMPEDFAEMSNEELMEVIEKGLYVDEGNDKARFKSNKRAEYLERAMYVCPYCGLSEFESKGNEIECKKCNRKIHYGEDTRLTGVGFDFPFEFVTQWYDYQKEYVCGLNPADYTEAPLYTEKSAFIEVIPNKRKNVIDKEAEISLYGDRVVVNQGKDGEALFDFAEITAVSVLGRNKLNIYYDKRVFQLKSGKRFNSLKYLNLYYRYLNVSKGDNNGKFLGL